MLPLVGLLCKCIRNQLGSRFPRAPIRAEMVIGRSPQGALTKRSYYEIIQPMTPRPVATFRVDQELIDGLREIEERDGVRASEQVRRAIRAWLESRGVSLRKTERKRAATRKRP
jgi:hypothetical protein